MSLDSHIFEELSCLEGLSFFSNIITTFQSDAFAGLHNLKKLILKFNNLTNLDPHVFKHLKNLECLNLSENQLTSVDHDAFTGLHNLKGLYLKSIFN